MSAPQLTCLHCGSPIPFTPGKSTHFQCAKCGTAFDLIPQAADPTAIVEAVPVVEGPFADPPPAPQPVPQPVVVLPQPVPVATSRADDDEDEDDRPRRGRRRRDEDEEDEDEDDRRDRRRESSRRDEDDDRRDRRREAPRRGADRKRPDSGAKIAIIVCVAAVLLVAAAIGGYFVFRDTPKEKEVAKKDSPSTTTPKKDAPKKDDGPLTPEQLLRKVKPSTVYIRSLARDGSGGTGTGFVAGNKPGYVVTNAHVVGYKLGEIRKPDKIEVVIDSGDAGERTIPAEIYGLDIFLDLAVLKVEPRGMPAALKFGKAEQLIETQDVVAFGYPFGEFLGKSVTVSSTKVSSLRRDRGTIETIQLAGGLNPGNSGGPVVNVKGEVVGVSVAKFRGAEIAFAIPAETAERFLEDMFANGGEIRTGGLGMAPMGPVGPAPVPEIPTPPARAAGWAPLRIPPPKVAALGAPSFPGEAVELKPPAAIDGACVGGGGRFLVCHLRDDNKLAILDLNAAKIVKTLPVPEKVLFAAGMESLIVVDPDEDTVERYSLATFAREATADLPVSTGLNATAIAMGCASNGPLVVQALDFPRTGERFLIDVATLKEIRGSRTSDGVLAARPGDELRASGDGRAFTQWNPEGQSAVILVTDTGYHESKFPSKVPGTATVPGGDGQSVYGLEEIAGRGGRRSSVSPEKGASYVPAATGPLFLALPKPGAATFGVHAGRDRAPLFEVPVPPALAAVLDRDAVPLVDRHVFFAPAAGVLAVIAPNRDRVTLLKLDVDAQLAKAGDYLFVTSTPPPAVTGKTVTYQLVVKSNKPPTGFKVVGGPTDIAVTDTGRVTCSVPPRVTNHVPVVVAITDAAGKLHRHEFELVPITLPE